MLYLCQPPSHTNFKGKISKTPTLRANQVCAFRFFKTRTTQNYTMTSYTINTTLADLSSAPCISLPFNVPTSEVVKAFKRQPTTCVAAIRGGEIIGVLNALDLMRFISEECLCIRAASLEQLISSRFALYPSSTRVIDLLAKQPTENTIDNIIIASPTGSLRSLCAIRLNSLIQLKQSSLGSILGAAIPTQQPIPATASCLNALEMLSHENVHFLTVIEDGKALGVVTRSAISNAIQQQKNIWDMTVRSVTETALPMFRASDQAHTVLAKIEPSKLAFYTLDSGALVVITKQQLENALGLHIRQQLPTPNSSIGGACYDSAALPGSYYSLDQPLKTGILGFTTSLTIHSFNQAALDLLDIAEIESENTHISTIAERLPALKELEDHISTLSKDKLPEIRLRGQPTGAHAHLKLSLSGVWDGNDLRGYILTMQDTTEMVLAETRLRKLAYFDSLTGLPNRLLFAEKLSGEISRSTRTGEVFALLFADLDHFKKINDTYGHHIGDEVLKHFTQIILSHLRDCDTVGRLAGDEFTIILPGVKTENDVAVVIDKINNSLYKPLLIAGSYIYVECSIGYAFFPHNGTNTESLIAYADRSMYLEKGRKC